jgi:ribosome-binding factor A
MNSRKERIRKALIKEISDIILRHVKDPRIATVVSVIDIELSNDYTHAKVYISVFGTQEEKEESFDAILDAASYIRSEVGRRIRLRHTPELEFKLDDSLERGSKINSLLDKISRGEL